MNKSEERMVKAIEESDKEIEKLQTTNFRQATAFADAEDEVRRLQEDIDTYQRISKTHEAEIEQLRGGMKKIQDIIGSVPPNSPWGVMGTIRETATAALTENEEEFTYRDWDEHKEKPDG